MVSGHGALVLRNVPDGGIRFLSFGEVAEPILILQSVIICAHRTTGIFDGETLVTESTTADLTPELYALNWS